MGIESFENNSALEAKVEIPEADSGTQSKVRPYLSERVHRKVNLFSANSGLTMYRSYNMLIDKAIEDVDILEQILTKDNEYSDNLTDSEIDLLEDLVSKTNDLGRFPTRSEINKDSELNGFPIYVTYLGKRCRIKKLIEDMYSDRLSADTQL